MTDEDYDQLFARPLLHFVGLAMLFIGYGLEWIVSAFLRGAATTDQVRAWLRVYRHIAAVSGPGLLVLILSGAYRAQISVAMKNGWLSASGPRHLSSRWSSASCSSCRV